MTLPVSRRNFLLSSAAAAAATRLTAQSKPVLPVRELNHMTLTCSDVKRSLEFYQGLFGMPIQTHQGVMPLLRVGDGPTFIALGAAGQLGKPGINHLCLNTPGFSVDKTLEILAAHGVSKAEPGGRGGGLSGGPLKVRIRMRGEESGGAKEGTPELYFGDPNGHVVQIQDTSYCGGSGLMGETCKAEAAPKKGLLNARFISHFTMMAHNLDEQVAFYTGLFGMKAQAYQGKAPSLAVGAGPEFLFFMQVPATVTPIIHHVCLAIPDFNADRVMKTLAEFGVQPRGDMAGAAKPLQSWISLRREDRGGAKEGTPELYMTDPDGISIQIQDVKYCGGGGVLGEICKG